MKQSKLYEVKNAHPWWDSIPRPLDYMPSEANAEPQGCETLQIKAWYTGSGDIVISIGNSCFGDNRNFMITIVNYVDKLNSTAFFNTWCLQTILISTLISS